MSTTNLDIDLGETADTMAVLYGRSVKEAVVLRQQIAGLEALVVTLYNKVTDSEKGTADG